jgi:hypothetical protein
MRIFHNYMKIEFPLMSSVFIASFIFAAIQLTSCSDSERKMPYITNLTTVLINLGNASKKSTTRMEAAMPSGITTITITVTGPDMAPISKTISPLQSLIELSVPSGAARNFTAVATSPAMTYTGNTVATLPAGIIVSVPILMIPASPVYTNEGSADTPIEIPANSDTYNGHVGTGKSYYYTNPGSSLYLTVSIKDLTDDADLISYYNDSSFVSSEAPNFPLNYCGRLKDEKVTTSSFGDRNYYFIVDGSHTRAGASFTIRSSAYGTSTTPPPNIYLPDYPGLVSVGIPMLSRITTPDFANYYTAVVNPGRQYWINGHDYSIDTTTTVYQDPLYTSVIGTWLWPSNTFTAAVSTVYYTATGIAGNSFTLEMVANEGTAAAPIDLFPSDNMNYKRANYCIVGGLSLGSYYRFPAAAGQCYAVSIDSIINKNNVNIYVYDSPDFVTPIASIPTTDYIGEVSALSNSGYIYVRILPFELGTIVGATYLLSVTPTSAGACF